MLKFIFIFIYSLALPAEEHDIHVSICDVELRTQEVEVIVKTFIDDLQIAVGLVPGEEVPDDYTSADELIELYIRENISLSLANRQVHLKIGEISASNDAVWITMSADLTDSAIGTLSLSNSFLTEIYDDQTNIVNIRINDQKKTFSLDKKTKNITHEFAQ